jgi:hypothetical protein
MKHGTVSKQSNETETAGNGGNAWRTAVYLLIGLGLTYCLQPPVIVPPGNEFTAMHVVCFTILVGAAYLGAGTYRRRWMFMLYGLLGGCAFLGHLLPDSRDRIGIGLGMDSFGHYLARTLTFIIFAGVACYVAAAVRHWRAPMLRPDPRRCAECGYPLYGLPEKRCPECGTAFEQDCPPPPARE